MNYLLEISLHSGSIKDYEKPIIQWAKNQPFENLLTLDLDNHSDNWLLDKAAGIFEEAEKGVMVINIEKEFAGEEQPPPGGILKLLKTFAQQSRKNFKIVVNGHHPVIEQFTGNLPSGKLVKALDNEDLKKFITAEFGQENEE